MSYKGLVKDKKADKAVVSGWVRVQVTADVNITAPIARRLVNTELMKKVGQMIMAGEPELLIDGKKVYWKVRFWLCLLKRIPKFIQRGSMRW
jgi:hypothetical protein